MTQRIPRRADNPNETNEMRGATLFTIITLATANAAIAASASSSNPTSRHGFAEGFSSKSPIAACAIAKADANRMHCSEGATEKAIGACDCKPKRGGFTCRVEYVEVCREENYGDAFFAWTGTVRGSSTHNEKEACRAGRVESRRVACPTYTLQRDITSCECQSDGNRWTCLVDQRLYCRR